MRLYWILIVTLMLTACQNPHSTRADKANSTANSKATNLVYPPAKKVEQIDIYHGVKVADPYRWLENIDSTETKTWVEAENKITFDYLSHIPGRDKLKQRLTELWNFERASPPKHYGPYYFYSLNNGLQNQSVLYVTKGLAGTPRVLLDPNTLSSDGTVALKQVSISADGKYLAYGLSAAGSDWEDWYVLDVNSGRQLDDHLAWVKFSSINWRHNGSGFYYSRYDEPQGANALKAVNEFQKLYFHRLGSVQSDDKLVYERKDQPNWAIDNDVSDDGRYLVISLEAGTAEKNLILIQDLAKNTNEIKTLIGEWTASYKFLGNNSQTFYFLTDEDAPHYRIVAIDINKPNKNQWREIVPQTEQTLQDALIANRNIIAAYLKDAHSEVRRFDLKGKSLGSIELPGLGSVNTLTGQSSDTEIFYTYTNYTMPSSVYRFDLKSNTNTLYRAPKLAFDPEQFETRQVFYSSRDGTRVPMFITARKGMALTADKPTLLYGYGGFNISLTPTFSPAIAGWLDLGGIYAVANLRGGGEYGRDWHEAGMNIHKQNVFDDFAAAAQYLIAEKYTNPQKLAIWGRSNGGLLAAATELQHPELFAAAIPQVGVLDMLRFRDFTIGKPWESDYGSVDNEAEFKALHAYSPLHNVKKEVRYPATLILTGDHDDRVFPAHSFKFAAAMQAATNKRSNPQLIRIDTRAGHGTGRPTSQLIEETTDIYAFLLHVFGITL